MTGPALRLRDVERRFRRGRGVGPIDLEVAAGAQHAIEGPSGCGKSTLLGVIAGLDRANRGSIEIDGRCVDRVPVGRRDLGLIEQHLPLYEHLDGRTNVAMAVSGLDISREDSRRRVEEALGLADAESLATRRAGTLSGGNQQKIVIGKWLATRPGVLLLDEPTRGVDVGARSEIYRIMESLAADGAAILFASSDLEEIIAMSDRVLVMCDGRLSGELPAGCSESAIMHMATGRGDAA